MSDSVDRIFVHALNTVKRLPRTGSARPPDADRLKLYGLYKQSTEGDIEGVMARPDGNSTEGENGVSEIEKWESWRSNAGMQRTEAKRQYIVTLIATMHRYATTTAESRELVAELEFVWNQIKPNSASSSRSSPAQTGVSQEPQQSPLARYGARGLIENAEELRVLRPFSDDIGTNDLAADELQHSFQGGKFLEASGFGVMSTKLGERSLKRMDPVEQALVRMTVEITALREQIDATGSAERQQHRGLRAWMRFLAWAAIRHLCVDAAILALLILLARRQRSPIIEQGLHMAYRWATAQTRGLQISFLSRTKRSR